MERKAALDSCGKKRKSTYNKVYENSPKNMECSIELMIDLFFLYYDTKKHRKCGAISYTFLAALSFAIYAFAIANGTR
ncbi:hypothetical protein [Anaerobacillus alkalilacustris]|nr:hypothetical protein [Anaerobacillus alkalilacustris]